MLQTINEEKKLGSQTIIPTGFLRPLWEIGFTELHRIASKDGTTLLTLADLRRRYPDMGVKSKHATAIKKLGRHIGGKGIYGMPPTFRQPPQDRPPALLLTMTGWETIPAEVREAESEQLRQDLEAGADHPPTSMHSESTGTNHTVQQ